MLSKSEKISDIKEFLRKTKLDAGVVGQTLGIHESSVSPQVMLLASGKIIKVSKKEVEPDDRDNLRFSKFMGIEDYVKEHIDKDVGKMQWKAKQKIQHKKNLTWLSAGFFTPQVRSVVIGNALTQNIDGINPLEFYDSSHRVTKLGPGGIPSLDAVPDESRQISNSSFGFLDPLHTAESDKIGVSNYFTGGVIKGKDNKIYRTMKELSTGKTVWVDHEKLLNSVVLIPEH